MSEQNEKPEARLDKAGLRLGIECLRLVTTLLDMMPEETAYQRATLKRVRQRADQLRTDAQRLLLAR